MAMETMQVHRAGTATETDTGINVGTPARLPRRPVLKPKPYLPLRTTMRTMLHLPYIPADLHPCSATAIPSLQLNETATS